MKLPKSFMILISAFVAATASTRIKNCAVVLDGMKYEKMCVCLDRAREMNFNVCRHDDDKTKLSQTKSLMSIEMKRQSNFTSLKISI